MAAFTRASFVLPRVFSVVARSTSKGIVAAPMRSLQSFTTVKPVSMKPVLISTRCFSTANVKSDVMEIIHAFAPTATEDSSFQDLGLDSLDVVEVVMEIEEKFGIEIPEGEAEKLVGLSELIKYLESK